MTTKLKIDLNHGVLEVEGSESFVRAIYSDFKVHFIGDEAGESLTAPSQHRRRRSTSSHSVPSALSEVAPVATATEQPSVETAPELSTEPEATTPKPAHRFLDKLNLSAGDGRVSLVEFMDTKFPITNEERNLVFLYYLQYLLKEKAITEDYIYTCYKAAKIRVPLNLENSLETTARQRRWIKITKTGRLSATPSGKMYVEKQLPKKLKS